MYIRSFDPSSALEPECRKLVYTKLYRSIPYYCILYHTMVLILYYGDPCVYEVFGEALKLTC